MDQYQPVSRHLMPTAASPFHLPSNRAPFTRFPSSYGRSLGYNTNSSISAAHQVPTIKNEQKEARSTTSAMSTSARRNATSTAPGRQTGFCDDRAVYDEYYECWTSAPAHYGAIRFCEGDEHTTPVRVCEGCVDITQQMFEQKRPALLKVKWLPVCNWCTSQARDNLASGEGFLGCRCPLGNPNSEEEKENHRRGLGKLLCRHCRQKELEKARMKYETEVELRRGPIGVDFDKGEIETLFIGLRCLCENVLPGGSRPYGSSKRCGGCGGIHYNGASPMSPW
jgi:hypothetical protein